MSPTRPDRRVLLLFLLTAAAPAADLHLGVATCASSVCHGAAAPVAKGDVRQDEYVTWSRFDPHAKATAVLLDERSVAIARRLGLPNARDAKECLDCHADNVPAPQRGAKFVAADGIGCEACHGGAEGWLATHYDTPRIGHADNLKNGMAALDDPAARSAVCLRCHVGDAERFASHRLMAAGHPRLAFELDTFTELWRTSGGREHFVRDDDYRRRKVVPAPAATWSLGLAREATQVLEVIRTRYAVGGALPDFALFDCYSCHRGMRLRQWRERESAGRLRFDDSVFAMLSASLAGHAPLRERLDAGVRALQKAAGGPAADVNAALTALDATLAEVTRQVTAAPLDAAGVPAVLKTIGDAAGRGEYADYAGAEQAALALNVLLAGAPPGDPARRTLDDLYRALEDDERYDARRFRELLRRLPVR